IPIKKFGRPALGAMIGPWFQEQIVGRCVVIAPIVNAKPGGWRFPRGELRPSAKIAAAANLRFAAPGSPARTPLGNRKRRRASLHRTAPAHHGRHLRLRAPAYSTVVGAYGEWPCSRPLDMPAREWRNNKRSRICNR